VGQAAALTAVGVVAGLAAALALARFMATLLFGVSPHDPLTFAATPLILGLVAAAAAIIPARRAARVDPIAVLRD
jgi:ABC-type antimicrobial peptide transport system permease subunit